MECKYKKEVIRFLEGEIENDALMEHIEQCSECKALLERHLEESEGIFKDVQGDIISCEAHNFKKYIYKLYHGLSRIIVFTLIGIVMGWLSKKYISDPFIITKIFIAVPYKISDVVYRYLYEPIHLYQGEIYFPQAGMVAWLAERVTPMLIGGAIYGSIGYFTGNRKVFTWRKYFYFMSTWLLIILMWIGSMFAANEWCLRKNDHLAAINGFELSIDHKWGYYAKENAGIYYIDSHSQVYSILRNALGDVKSLMVLNEKDIVRSEPEVKVIIYMGMKRKNTTMVNWKEKYMILESGKIIRISDEFAQYMKEFCDSAGVFEEK